MVAAAELAKLIPERTDICVTQKRGPVDMCVSDSEALGASFGAEVKMNVTCRAAWI